MSAVDKGPTGNHRSALCWYMAEGFRPCPTRALNCTWFVMLKSEVTATLVAIRQLSRVSRCQKDWWTVIANGGTAPNDSGWVEWLGTISLSGTMTSCEDQCNMTLFEATESYCLVLPQTIAANTTCSRTSCMRQWRHSIKEMRPESVQTDLRSDHVREKLSRRK